MADTPSGASGYRPNAAGRGSRPGSGGVLSRPWRIYLSPPDTGPDERELLLDAFDSNWIAPVGPHVDAFEREVASRTGVEHAVALSSGTAALHLALLVHGVGPGDEVWLPTLTFVASANAVRYVGAEPVFVDVCPDTWTIDPALVAGRRPPKAMITVDLYGQCADHDPMSELGVPVIEDAAEALGATYKGRPAGSLGDVGVLSFNGNKIITTSGGGMLLTDDADVAARVRRLATQAREDVAHYEHRELGYNYRLSNLLAALGRGQLRGLSGKIARRAAIRARYESRLGDVVSFMPIAPYGTSNHWLTCGTVSDRDAVLAALHGERIEARPVWKPMHLQPLYADAACIGGEVAARLFETGICLPSGSTLSDAEIDEIASIVRRAIA